MKKIASMALELKGISLQYKDKLILDGLDLSVPTQETQVVMGLSGCGKSTLLSIILGLLVPSAGSIKFKQQEMRQLSREKLNEARTHIGMVFQNAALMSSLSISENVALPLQELTNKSTKEIKSITEEKLALVGLSDAGSKFPSELSGGMQKRAGMARALALNPELVLFDEPTAGLDPITSDLINNLIVTLKEKHKVTSIIVTHEMDSAFFLASSMAFLSGGKILLNGTPEDFRKSEIPIIQKFLSSYSAHDK